ncbi:MAG: Do family serine endopeptidase [Dyella sp.]
MTRPLIRNLVCSVVLLVALDGAVQAQSPPAVAALPDFTGIVQSNAGAVVHVEAKYSGKSRMSGASGQDLPDDEQDLLRRFFGMPMQPSPADQQRISVGSGFILSKDGYILTNNHVVEDADSVTVRLQDRRSLVAKVVGTDPKYDIALLKVTAGAPLPAVTIGDSRALKPGQWVLAIGSPFGFDYTVTQGIVSAVGRNLGSQDQPYTSFIQTDVPINRGNSGGPLFNLQGQVVGINSQIYSSTGGYQGVAFSIPIDVAMSAVEQLKTRGYVSRGMLGVMVQGVSADMVKGFGLGAETGAAVTSVEPGSGAEKAGLRAGDVILSFNGTAIDQASDLPPLVATTKPGSQASVVIMRGGKRQTVPVTITELPRDKNGVETASSSQAKSGAAALGLTVQEVDNAARKSLGLQAGEGVVISNVNGAPAAQAGLQAGDVILMVGQTRVGSVAQFRAATAEVKPGETVLLLVRHGDTTGFVGLTLPSK